jgi:hypothetical protein
MDLSVFALGLGPYSQQNPQVRFKGHAWEPAVAHPPVLSLRLLGSLY